MIKILLIEDEKLLQKSLKKLLEKKGASVDVESSGKGAIERIRACNYDRIICDLMLQDISGFDVIEESKQRYSIGQISSKFIIITAYGSPQVHARAEEYGCKILTKPFQDNAKALETFLTIEE
jgi:CheY-like chemotaxis protein